MKKLNKKMNESSSDQDRAMNLLDIVYEYGNLCQKLGLKQGKYGYECRWDDDAYLELDDAAYLEL